MTKKLDPYSELTLGTILRITNSRSGESHYTMRLASGEWWEVFTSKTQLGQTIYTFGEKAIDHKMMKRAELIDIVIQGLQVGDVIAMGVQVLALPLDSVMMHNGTRGRCVRTPDGMINDQGKAIPYLSIMPNIHMWES